MTQERIPEKGSRWLRTEKSVRGQGLHVVIVDVVPTKVADREISLVFYRHEKGSKRSGNMPLDKFLQPGNFIPALPALPAVVPTPPAPVQLSLTGMGALDRLEAKLDKMDARLDRIDALVTRLLAKGAP